MSLKGVVLLTVGGLLMVAALLVSVRTIAFLRSSTVANGTVEALNAGGSHPQVAFVTAAGERVSYPQGGFVFGWRVGDAVRVRYAPARPRDAVMDRVGAIWTPAILLLVIGLGMVSAGWGALKS